MTNPSTSQFRVTLSCGGPPALDLTRSGPDLGSIAALLEDFLGDEERDSAVAEVLDWSRSRRTQPGHSLKIRLDQGVELEARRVA